MLGTVEDGSYLRVSRSAKRAAAKLMHAGQLRQAERQVRRLLTWLGRGRRKINGDANGQAALAEPVALIGRLLHQRRDDKAELYSLHALEVECIGKGKAHARFEFGVKISVAAINCAAPGGQFVVGMRALLSNPYDCHTLAAQLAQTERLTGVAIERAYVDRGYRGHDGDRARVFISRQKRNLTPTIPRELRRRNAI
jgi:IS5 family transposase